MERTYAPLGRLLTETVNGQDLALGYDALGRLVPRRTPSGHTRTWTYAPGGSLTALPRARTTSLSNATRWAASPAAPSTRLSSSNTPGTPPGAWPSRSSPPRPARPKAGGRSTTAPTPTGPMVTSRP
ncbi:hypothetical protein E1265_24970 [Streptomyces sp. 8K308]|nr:hypothetical protein E1265_24970 [Streptomyces sp. 8K308]